MEKSRVYIYGCHYFLGEEERRVAEIPGLAGWLAQNQMIDDAGLWGWDRFRVSDRPAVELMAETARRSLADFDARQPPVDAVILCATRFPTDVDGHADFIGRLLDRLGLHHAIPYGFTLNRCATLTSALGLAATLVGSGRHHSILLTAGDTNGADDERLRPFAVFSDGAASCIVSAGQGGEFQLLDAAAAVDARMMKRNGEISADLTRQVNAELFERAQVDLRDIKRLAHNNLWRPIVAMKEQQAGFRRDQLYLDNIPRIGHVFSCDPLINMIDLAVNGLVAPGDLLALGSSVSGARFGALLRKT
jgi:3-oxoacyl-[acyl-carrier-protein] synthase III